MPLNCKKRLVAKAVLPICLLLTTAIAKHAYPAVTLHSTAKERDDRGFTSSSWTAVFRAKLEGRSYGNFRSSGSQRQLESQGDEEDENVFDHPSSGSSSEDGAVSRVSDEPSAAPAAAATARTQSDWQDENKGIDYNAPDDVASDEYNDRPVASSYYLVNDERLVLAIVVPGAGVVIFLLCVICRLYFKLQVKVKEQQQQHSGQPLSNAPAFRKGATAPAAVVKVEQTSSVVSDISNVSVYSYIRELNNIPSCVRGDVTVRETSDESSDTDYSNQDNIQKLKKEKDIEQQSNATTESQAPSYTVDNDTYLRSIKSQGGGDDFSVTNTAYFM